jgi:hypothetical protein
MIDLFMLIAIGFTVSVGFEVFGVDTIPNASWLS